MRDISASCKPVVLPFGEAMLTPPDDFLMLFCLEIVSRVSCPSSFPETKPRLALSVALWVIYNLLEERGDAMTFSFLQSLHTSPSYWDLAKIVESVPPVIPARCHKCIPWTHRFMYSWFTHSFWPDTLPPRIFLLSLPAGNMAFIKASLSVKAEANEAPQLFPCPV